MLLYDGLVWNWEKLYQLEAVWEKKVDLRLGLVRCWRRGRGARNEGSRLECQVRGARGKISLSECQVRYRDDRQGLERRRGGWSTRTLGTRDSMSEQEIHKAAHTYLIDMNWIWNGYVLDLKWIWIGSEIDESGVKTRNMDMNFDLKWIYIGYIFEYLID